LRDATMAFAFESPMPCSPVCELREGFSR